MSATDHVSLYNGFHTFCLHYARPTRAGASPAPTLYVAQHDPCRVRAGLAPALVGLACDSLISLMRARIQAAIYQEEQVTRWLHLSEETPERAGGRDPIALRQYMARRR